MSGRLVLQHAGEAVRVALLRVIVLASEPGSATEVFNLEWHPCFS
jgi:hypothetical protein